MKKVTPQSYSILLFFLCFFTHSFLNAQIDLELSVTQTEQAPDAWTNYSIVATISNKGTTTATGIEVAIAKPSGTVYQGGNEFTATAGTFYPYSNSKDWIISSLGANATATLTINLFTVSDAINPVYAQVASASPQDVDSTPGNGVAPNVAEDDEAYSGQTQSTKPDLRLTDVQIANSGNPGSDVSYTLDLVNAGNRVATGDYSIEVYLSQSAGQTSGTLVGEINTGNTPIGTINNVNGAINIPDNFAAGNWFAVFYVDAKGDIAESNENNNIVSIPFEVNDIGGPVGDFCGFEKTFFDMPEYLFNPRPTLTQTGEELNGNYIFNVRNGNGQVGFNTVALEIDDQGNQVSIDENAGAFPTTDNQLANGNTYVAEQNGANISVQVIASNGNIIFDKTYSNLANSNRASSSSSDPKLILRNNGYYLYGAWIDSASPNPTLLYLAKLGATGNLQGFTEFEYSGSAESMVVDAVAVHTFGDLLLTVKNLTNSYIDLVRVNLQGISWRSQLTVDLVTNRATSPKYDVSENAVYFLLFFNNEQHVRKINAWNGNTIWTTKLADEFNPNSSSIRFFNLATNLLLTEDGGVATGYVFRGIGESEFQTEIGKLDRNGNAVWWRQFDWDEVNILTAMFETADGGIVFAGRNADNYLVYKLNENGQPSPGCSNGPSGGAVDLDLSYTVNDANPSQWDFFTTSLTIRNTGGETATGVVVNVDLPDGVVPQGGNEYSSSQGSFKPYGNGNWTVGNLAAGATAIIQINYFLKSADRIDFYAQVISANEADADSAPNNGTIGSPNEDDEASISINSASAPLGKIAGTSAALKVDKLLKLYPNPVLTGEVNLVIDSKEARATTIEVYNSQGQLIRTDPIEMTAGLNQFGLSVDGYASGIYFLMLRSESGKVMRETFFVERK